MFCNASQKKSKQIQERRRKVVDSLKMLLIFDKFSFINLGTNTNTIILILFYLKLISECSQLSPLSHATSTSFVLFDRGLQSFSNSFQVIERISRSKPLTSPLSLISQKHCCLTLALALHTPFRGLLSFRCCLSVFLHLLGFLFSTFPPICEAGRLLYQHFSKH